MSDSLDVMPLDANREMLADFRVGLAEARSAYRAERQFFKSARLGWALSNDRRLKRVYNRAQLKAKEDYPGDAESLADGEFLKWFLEWLEDGGWELILEIIKALMALG